jgi:hypothetical protein
VRRITAFSFVALLMIAASAFAADPAEPTFECPADGAPPAAQPTGLGFQVLREKGRWGAYCKYSDGSTQAKMPIVSCGMIPKVIRTEDRVSSGVKTLIFTVRCDDMFASR